MADGKHKNKMLWINYAADRGTKKMSQKSKKKKLYWIADLWTWVQTHKIIEYYFLSHCSGCQPFFLAANFKYVYATVSSVHDWKLISF